MAYISQQTKAGLAPTIKAICKKHGVKATLAVGNHMTLILNVNSGKIDFFGDYELEGVNGDIRVNPYHYKSHFVGRSLRFLSEVIPAMNKGNHDNSDPMTDYFDVGWYIDVNIGRWNRPYTVEQ